MNLHDPLSKELVINDFGVFLSKKSERVLIKREGKLEEEHALCNLEQITICGRGISLSVDLIEACVERGVQLNFLSPGGKPYAKITSPALSATVLTRREQILAYGDDRGVQFSREIVSAKTKNQVNLLKYFGKYRRKAAPTLFDDLQTNISKMEEIRTSVEKLKADRIEDIRGQLLSIEGRVGQLYWDGVASLLSEDLAFSQRLQHGASDSVNSCLNYGYGILYSRVWGAVMLAGLEPYAGFLHVDRPGKPSLVLDMVEEFRQPVVDRAIFAWLNKGGKPEQDEDGLTKNTRNELAQRISERLESVETYEGKKQKIRQIIQEQSRRLATFLRRQRPYEGFTCSW